MQIAHQAERSRARVLAVLAYAFRQNPWFRAVASPVRHPRRYRAVLAYAYAVARARGGVHLAPGEQAVALYYVVHPGDPEPWSLRLRKTWLALRHFAWRDVPAILRHQARVVAARPRGGPYLYVWFLGATPLAARAGATRVLVDELFATSRRLRLPIYVETTEARNRAVYERFGFATYASVSSARLGITSYCLRRPLALALNQVQAASGDQRRRVA